jgi:ribosomal subunit interface protein
MDIVVKGRNVEVPEHYRALVSEKLARLERYDKKVIRYDVELFHEPNRRQSKNCQRVEITGKGKGPAVRAEACAGDFYAALDSAVNKIENRMRKQHDRRRVHYGRRSPESVSAATSAASGDSATADSVGYLTSTAVMEVPADPVAGTGAAGPEEIPQQQQRWDDGAAGYEPGRVVREKQHSADPITVDQALYEMELVGHDFFLFNDSAVGRPSVVYRRRGFDYGVIRLG